MASDKQAGEFPIIGFIKFKDAIGMYRADHQAWILDARAYLRATRSDAQVLLKRKDKRFTEQVMCPIRRDDIQALVDWFDASASLHPVTVASELMTDEYLVLDRNFEDHLPVVLYDFDERISYENPDRNPYIPFDDYLPEGWQNIVVEGFDALVPDAFNYWSRFEAKLENREETTL